MKRNIVALILAAIMLMATFAACGGSTLNVSPSPAASGEPASGGSYTIGIVQIVQHAALDNATQGFMDALTEKLGDKVKFDLQNANGDPNTCAIISNKFVSENVDLILANATPALQAAQTATNKIPILGTSVTDYGTALGIKDWAGKTGKNISGTSDLPPLDEQAAVLNELFPDAKRVGILYCSSEPNSKYQSQVITKHLTDMGYTCKDYTFSDSNDLHTVATNAASDSDVIYLPTDNTVASNTQIIRSATIDKNVPVIAGEESICAGTGVATLSISYYDLGYTTGEMAYEILVNGADPGTMDIKFSPEFAKKFNAKICSELGITPPGGYSAIE